MTYEDFAATAAFGLAPGLAAPWLDPAALTQQGAGLGFLHIPAGTISDQAEPARLMTEAANAAPSFEFQLAVSSSGTGSGAAEAAATTLASGGTSGDDPLFPDDTDPTLTGNDGVDDEETGGDATVIGYREESYAGGGTSGGGADGGSDGTGSGDYGGTGGDAETTEANDCRDRNALEAGKEIAAEPDDGHKEHGSLIYRDINGLIRHSPIIQGDDMHISRSAVEEAMRINNISFDQIVGFVHNHPKRWYGGDTEIISVNSYPSGNDWGFSDYMIANGANGGLGIFAIYIINPDGDIFEFSSKDKDFYYNLGSEQKEDRIALPKKLQDDGTSCA
jgi:hypothetical protein